MTKYHNLVVYYKINVEDGFSTEHYNLITDSILEATKKKYEDDYKNGKYAALRFEFDTYQGNPQNSFILETPDGDKWQFDNLEEARRNQYLFGGTITKGVKNGEE